MVMISRAMLFFLFSGLLFGLFLLVHINPAGRINAAQLAQSPLAQGAFFFQLALGFNSKTSPRDGFQAWGWNRLACQFANAIGALFNALEGFLDFINGVLIGGKQA